MGFRSRFSAVVVLVAASCPGATAQAPPRSDASDQPLRFYVGAQYFQGNYELFLPLIRLPYSTDFDYDVKPWQLTAGRNLTRRLAVQLSYSYTHRDYVNREAYVNSAGQAIQNTYHDEAILNCLPLLARYDATIRSRAMHVDVLLGLTGISKRAAASVETTINGQPADGRYATSRETLLYATGGVGFHYGFGRRINAVLDLTLNRNLRPRNEIGGNVWGLTWASGLGLHYRFAIPKKAHATR